MSVAELTDIRRAALRLEMAVGRVHSITHGGSGDASEIEQAIFDRDSERNAFRAALADLTGIEANELARLIAL